MIRYRFYQFGLISILTFLSAATGSAQGTSEVIFQQLREKNLEGAFETLGTISDAGLYWSRDQADGMPAAVGGLARLLSQERDSDHYDRLYKWTMPNESRQRIRLLTTPVPHDAPPEIFARVLRERPRETSFQVSSINGIRGLYCSGWTLVMLADKLGRLDRLVAELEELHQQNVPDADVLLLLAKMAHRQSDVSAIRALLTPTIERVSQTSPEGMTPDRVIHPSILALGAAALGRDELASSGEEILRTLRDKANWLTAYRIRGFLHGAHAVAVQRALGGSESGFLYENQLKYWVPASIDLSYTSAEGSTARIWLAHEDHLLHLTGAYNDLLFFRYPLTGEFEFSSEVQSTAPLVSNAAFGYGGLYFQALGVTRELTVWDADLGIISQKPCPFARAQATTSFNRVAIRSDREGSSYSINRHPMWSDRAETAASPFIAFRYYGNHRSLIRNLQLAGNPVIPREVALSSGTQLRGWLSRFFRETKRSAQLIHNPNTKYDWTLQDGEIQAGRIETQTSRQSLLRYQRPLLEDETIRYEFFYVPGETEVHPSLGRLAFLIEPAGVRIHWITDGPVEWTGLPEDNATLEPLNRRGPRPLPLKQQDWNAVELSRTDDKLTLALNGEAIYERPLDFAGDTNFGLFRDPSKCSVRVRNVILSGDWPETIPEEFSRNPAAVIDEAKQSKNRLSLHSLAGPQYLASNVLAVRRRAAALPLAERYEFLADWVLPNDRHPDLRFVGEFTPTDPSPLAVELEPYRYRDQQGAELASPLFDLLETAVELGRVEELSQRVNSLPASDDLEQQRGKLALQILLLLELGEREHALQRVDELQLLMHESFKLKTKEYWPEIHLIVRGLHRHSDEKIVGGLISDLFQQRLSLRLDRLWQNHILSLSREYEAIVHGLDDPRTSASAGLQRWKPVTKTIAEFRGAGSPQTRWTFTNEQILTLGSGQSEDYLFYQSPLAGDYEVHCKMSAYGNSQVMTQGTFVGPKGDGQQTMIGTYRTGGRNQPISYPVIRHDVTVYYRAVVEDRTTRVTINGQPVTEYSTTDVPDSWVSVRSLSNSNTAFHNFQIGGNPTIPDEVVMTTANDLACWIPYDLGSGERTWSRIEDTDGRGLIYGSRNTELAGSYFEALLRYHRPLWEDGSIEYEFFYNPDRMDAHPALDRLVFLLNPDGVRLHWITDGEHDRTEVSPGNVIYEPENRRGPEQLPFNLNNWNRVKLSLEGSQVSLELNGQLIYQRELESTNHRTFGLFHYADRTELLARHLTMRGDWPKTLPRLSDQELADPALVAAERNLEELKVGFHHDFTRDGLPIPYFTYTGVNPAAVHEVVPGGVLATMRDATNWQGSAMIPRFSLQGDFDVQAEIDELDFTESGVEGGALLDLKLDDEMQHYLRIMRLRREDSGDHLNAEISPLHPNGRRSYLGLKEVDVSPAGTLRIARLGDRILFMFAGKNSSVFRVIREETISDADVLMHGIQLKTSLRDGRRSSVLWKNVTIRAEGMKFLSPQNDAQLKQLSIMNADGSNLRDLTGVLPGMTNLGSPEFSSDGKQIALDMSQGSVASSHIIVLNSDGTGVRDLGPGCMPSFSPDGKKIAITQSGTGIVLMDSDGTNREVIEPRGWGVQYSPDGKYIAYGLNGNIVLMSLETREKRELFTGETATRYSYTYWNLGWSHDSKSIAFQGRLRQAGGDELVVADIDEPNKFQVILPEATGINPDFTFTPDNRSVLFSKSNPEYRGPQLYLIHRNSPGELELLKGQPIDRKILNCAWSHDGKQIAFTCNLDPVPVDWHQQLESE